MALSVKATGHIGLATIGGKIATAGDDITSVELEGPVDTLTVAGGISATGVGADGVHLTGDASILDGITVTATGRDVVAS